MTLESGQAQQIERALRYMRLHQTSAAIDVLTGVLSEDPEHATAHALLSMCLRERKRLYAANAEARQALLHGSENPLSHVAAGLAAFSSREFVAAEEHYQQALNLDPESSWALFELGNLYLAWGKEEQAASVIDRACTVAPDDPDVWALRARCDLNQGDFADAETHAGQALAISPENILAVVVLGHALLRQGQSDEAREHALWAVRLAPDNELALGLLASVKARKSVFLGLWWRFQCFVTAGGTKRTITLLVGLYLMYRVLALYLDDNDLKRESSIVSSVWLAFCAYTWFAPAIFNRMLSRELNQARLRPDY